ncbi:MAG TPA: undecaprenyl/decaprenyl-phosphate alpha-N-acetylglucosaminyl 1-phosphate transferase, partial [Candidatus Syntrophosphaera sp.]|nr:undecaprenyl/decaprenyl-phosphate alpha-N-acetylglucosaminyl 1-phosphate transferase [Candidatus Syntrophosphaera sp.]
MLIIFLSLGIFLLTHLLVPLNIRLSKRFGILALPNERKIHTQAIPEAGGLSFALPMMLAQLVLGLTLLPDLSGRMMLQLAGVEAIALILGV